jgi:hypothetical protein
MNQVESTPLGDVEVSFKPAESAACSHVDDSGNDRGPLHTGRFAQVVIATGHYTEFDESDTLAAMFGPYIPAAAEFEHHALSGVDGRLIGLRSPGEEIRILGMAALNHAATRILAEKDRRFEDYKAHLCGQARPLSITMAATNIGEANGLFRDGRYNRNVNAAPAAQLEAFLISQGVAKAHQTAHRICVARGSRPDPWLQIAAEYAGYGFVLDYREQREAEVRATTTG